MRPFHKWLFLALFVAILGCASGRDFVNPTAETYGPGRSWWGTDAVCSPGCPPGVSGQW